MVFAMNRKPIRALGLMRAPNFSLVTGLSTLTEKYLMGLGHTREPLEVKATLGDSLFI